MQCMLVLRVFLCRSAAELAAAPAKRTVRVLQAAGFSGSDAAAAVDAAGGDGPAALAALCARACAALPGASRQRALAELPDVHSAPLSSPVAAEKALPAVEVIRSSACLVRSLAVSLLLGVPWQHICCGLVRTRTLLRARHSHAVPLVLCIRRYILAVTGGSANAGNLELRSALAELLADELLALGAILGPGGVQPLDAALGAGLRLSAPIEGVSPHGWLEARFTGVEPPDISNGAGVGDADLCYPYDAPRLVYANPELGFPAVAAVSAAAAQCAAQMAGSQPFLHALLLWLRENGAAAAAAAAARMDRLDSAGSAATAATGRPGPADAAAAPQRGDENGCAPASRATAALGGVGGVGRAAPGSGAAANGRHAGYRDTSAADPAAAQGASLQGMCNPGRRARAQALYVPPQGARAAPEEAAADSARTAAAAGRPAQGPAADAAATKTKKNGEPRRAAPPAPEGTLPPGPPGPGQAEEGLAGPSRVSGRDAGAGAAARRSGAGQEPFSQRSGADSEARADSESRRLATALAAWRASGDRKLAKLRCVHAAHIDMSPQQLACGRLADLYVR